MKISFYIFRNVLLLTVLSLVSCTLIDNDLRDLPDNPAFREVVHEEGEGWKADYQYQPWTVIIDDVYYNYVHQMDYATMTLYLYDYIPEDMLPKKDNVMAANPSEKLEWGLAAKVKKVSRNGSYYAIEMEQAGVDEVFLHLVYEQAGDYQFNFQDYLDNTDDTGTTPTRSLTMRRVNQTRAGEKPIPYDDPNSPDWIRDVDEASTFTFDHNKLLKTLKETATTVNIAGSLIPKIKRTWSSDYVTGYIDAAIGLNFKVAPMMRTKQFYNLDKKQFDVYIAFGATYTMGFQLEGNATLDVNLWKLLKLPNVKPIWVGAPIGLPIFFQAPLGLTWSTKVSGKLNIEGKKYWDSVIGYRKNIPGEKDGPYSIPHNPAATVTTGDTDGDVAFYMSFDTGIDLSIEPGLVIGVPDDPTLIEVLNKYKTETGGTNKAYPNVKLYYKPSIGFHFNTEKGIDTKSGTFYDLTSKFYIPFKFGDLVLALNFWKDITFEKNLIDLVAGMLGYKNGDDYKTEINIWEYPFRWYPSIDNAEVGCVNPNETGTPEFVVGFDVNDVSGIDPRINNQWIGPSIVIKKGDEEILSILDFDKLKKEDKGHHFSRTIKDNRLKRDAVYTALIKMKEYIPEKHDYRDVFWKKVDFSTKTPSCHIKGHDFLLKHAYFKKVDQAKRPYGSATMMDWTFRTVLDIKGYREIQEVGFFIGSNRTKKWVCDGPPLSSDCKAIWKIEKNEGSTRTLNIYPYVKTTGNNIITWPDPYVLNLNFNVDEDIDPSFGKDGKAYRGYTNVSNKGKHQGVSFYVFGFEKEAKPTSTDLTATEEKKKNKARDTYIGDYIGIKEGVPTYEFTIDPDDLDDVEE